MAASKWRAWGRHPCLPGCGFRQTRMSAPRRITAVVLYVAALSGCGGKPSGPATVAATGTVTYNGSPLEGASVVFYPNSGDDDQRLTSQAITDQEGRFQLTTHVGGGKFKPGVVPGPYAVAISKLDTAAVKTTLAPPKNLLPKKYSDPKTSQFKADVKTDSKNDFQFELKSE
jgi:hypothetical protein